MADPFEMCLGHKTCEGSRNTFLLGVQILPRDEEMTFRIIPHTSKQRCDWPLTIVHSCKYVCV